MKYFRVMTDRETLSKQFPVAMKHFYPMPYRNPFAYSFLPLWTAFVSCRVGNLLRIVSCRYETLLSHAV